MSKRNHLSDNRAAITRSLRRIQRLDHIQPLDLSTETRRELGQLVEQARNKLAIGDAIGAAAALCGTDAVD